MNKFFRTVFVAALLGALIVAGGCGGGGDDAPPAQTISQTTPPIAATINPNGTATTGASVTNVTTAPGTTGYLATVSATLPPSTTITAKNADGTTKALTAPPSFTFTVPVDSTATKSGTAGVPVPSGFLAVGSTSGAVDVQLAGAASATFNPAVTITIPVPGKAVGSVIAVYTVSGATYTLLGNFAVTTAGFVSFPVTSLSWKVCDPQFTTPTGTTGSGGGS